MNNKNLIQFTQKSVQTTSITGQERTFIQLVSNEMNVLGYDRVWIDDAGTVIGEINGISPGKTILLDAHADTVSVNPEDWTFEPFSGIIHQDRIYGRGVADTKGNLAAMMYAAAKVDRKKISGKIFVSATVNEEVFEGGSLRVVIDQTQPDYVIIGEATNLNLNRGGRGRAEIIVETLGQSAHSSSPEVGECAVHNMIRLINSIESQQMKTDPILGPGSMVLTDILSAPFPGNSVVPNRCRVTFDRRLLVGETIASLENELLEYANRANVECRIYLLDATEITYTGYKIQGKKFFPAWLFPQDHILVEKSYKALKKSIPECKLGTFRFCTNGAYSAGISGIPTIGFGLGKETDAHTADESIAINDLMKATIGYQAIIEELLS